MRFYILFLVAITFMRLLCLYLLFFLLFLQEGFSLEQDAALSVIANDTVSIHVPYTKLFKVSNKHPSLGKLNVTVSYNLRKDGDVVMSGSFAKVINRYTTVDTGYLLINETGTYVLCGIVYGDSNASNNEACKTIYAIEGENTKSPKTKQTAAEQKKQPSILSAPEKNNVDIIKSYFTLNISQAANGTVFLWINASQQFSLTLKKGTNKLYSSVFPPLNGTIMLPLVPQKDGLYTIEISGIEKKKSYSVFLNGAANPISNKSLFNAPSPAPLTGFAAKSFNHERTNKKELIQLPLFALFFVPLFFLAAYIVLRK